MAVRFAEMIEAEFAIMHKTRPAHDQAEVTEVTGRVRDKIAIVGDDVIMTGGTLIANVDALRAQGVKGVWVYATHGVFCGGALEKFHDAPIDGIVVTDTVPIDRLARAAEHDGPAGRAAARRDDHERLRRRLRLGDLRRREPAVLGRRVLAGGTGAIDAVILASAVVPVLVVIVGAWFFLRAGRRHDDRERGTQPH